MFNLYYVFYFKAFIKKRTVYLIAQFINILVAFFNAAWIVFSSYYVYLFATKIENYIYLVNKTTFLFAYTTVIITLIFYSFIFVTTCFPLVALIIDNRLNYKRWI